jgi:hypothetical protein
VASSGSLAQVEALLLLVPEKADPERDAVAAAWELAGGSVLRIGRFWDPPEVDRTKVRVYGADTFCLVLAEELHLDLVSPPDRILADAPEHLLGRRLRVMTLADLRRDDLPAFVKPVIPKQFRGAIYGSIDDLAEETHGLASDVEIMVSGIVTLVAEARTFVLDGAVRACAVYEGAGNTGEAASFARQVARTLDLPRTCVVDVGLLADGEWVLIECNATWGAGLNGCDANSVIDCIEAASGAEARTP